MDLDEEDPKNKVSNRVKLLIKNMFENKESGWVKTKQETKELLKKGDIENQFIAAEEKKAAEQRGRDYDDRRFGNRDRDDKRDKGGQYMKKQASTTSDNKGGRDGKKRFNEDRNSKSGQYKPKGFERGGDKVEKIQLKPIDDLELGKRMVGFWTRVYTEEPALEEEEEKSEKSQAKDFSIVKNLLNSTCKDDDKKTPNKGEDLLFSFFNAVFDKDEKLLTEFLGECVQDLAKQTFFEKTAFLNATSRFMYTLNDMVSDVPKLPVLFSTLVLIPLLKNGKISL